MPANHQSRKPGGNESEFLVFLQLFTRAFGNGDHAMITVRDRLYALQLRFGDEERHFEELTIRDGKLKSDKKLFAQEPTFLLPTKNKPVLATRSMPVRSGCLMI